MTNTPADGNPKRSVGAPENTCSASTHEAAMNAKMARPPEAMWGARPSGRTFYALPPWDRRRPLTIKVKWRGGAEAWVEIHARGGVLRTPGHVHLVDVLTRIWNTR